ncbi:flagellar hook assembly protein FlgD [uncultured Methylobacterium sp.]|jgi:flagellar basal-body rod modification protein FlgD|uniref:flagellar hook assembly protein FlgD n=1 Tax=uncultured Methylobacterium sp. TaxID=157278 RepID=UPI00262A5AA0|nr:flagellar hook assembly protein FlgD [uncultured Methylobacterium sp.]
MTTVPATTPATTTSTAGTATKAGTAAMSSLGSDAFLKLLLAQLKNQDPTKPMDSTDYMGQLATFSEVEQSTKMNQKLDSLLSSSYLSQADGIIGRTVSSADGTVAGAVASVKLTSDGAVAQLANGKELLLGSGVVVS